MCSINPAAGSTVSPAGSGGLLSSAGMPSRPAVADRPCSRRLSASVLLRPGVRSISSRAQSMFGASVHLPILHGGKAARSASQVLTSSVDIVSSRSSSCRDLATSSAVRPRRACSSSVATRCRRAMELNQIVDFGVDHVGDRPRKRRCEVALERWAARPSRHGTRADQVTAARPAGPRSARRGRGDHGSQAALDRGQPGLDLNVSEQLGDLGQDEHEPRGSARRDFAPLGRPVDLGHFAPHQRGPVEPGLPLAPRRCG